MPLVGALTARAVAGLRAGFQELIRENPRSVVLTRRERVQADGGWAEMTSTVTLDPVRIARDAGPRDQSARELPGEIGLGWRWVLLAPYAADLRAGPRVDDEFTVPDLGTFRVVAVTPLEAFGERFGVRAELERRD